MFLFLCCGFVFVIVVVVFLLFLFFPLTLLFFLIFFIGICYSCKNKKKVYGRNAENEPVSRIKMADNRALVSMGTL